MDANTILVLAMFGSFILLLMTGYPCCLGSWWYCYCFCRHWLFLRHLSGYFYWSGFPDSRVAGQPALRCHGQLDTGGTAHVYLHGHHAG